METDMKKIVYLHGFGSSGANVQWSCFVVSCGVRMPHFARL